MVLNNMIRIWTLVLGFLLLIACGNKQIKTYYEDGTLETETPINDKGEYEGSSKRYYPSGKLELTAEYKNNLQNGLTIAYYENGQIKSPVPAMLCMVV